MANKRDNTEHFSAVDQQRRHEAALLFPKPAAAKRISAEQLHRIIQLLLLSRSNEDRRVVALHLYHVRKLRDVAGALSIGEARVKDTIESLGQRLKLAEADHRHAERLRRWFAKGGSAR